MSWTEARIARVSTEAMVSFCGQAEKFEAVLLPGCSLVGCGEPVADLNLIFATAGADERRFTQLAEGWLQRELPFLAAFYPSAPEELPATVSKLGLVHAVEFPFMVCERAPELGGAEDVDVKVASSADDMLASGRVLSAAFHMAEDAVRRALPLSLIDTPALDVYVAVREDCCVGSVTLTHHGDVSGVWAMATAPELQGRGIGRRLLSAAMRAAHEKGTREFFLGATPAGRPLYESLGYTTRVTAQVWAFGETGQA